MASRGGEPGTVVRRRHRRRKKSARGALLYRLLWLEPFWIGLLAPSLLFPGRFWVVAWQGALVLLLFVFWPLRIALRRVDVPQLVGLPVGALLLAAAWAIAASPAPTAAWEAAGYLLLGVALALALIQWPPVQACPAIVGGLLLAVGCAVAVGGPLLLGAMPYKFGLGALIPAAGRLGGAQGNPLNETVNPNVLGGALVIPFLLAAALAVGPRYTQQPWRLVWGILAAALLSVLLLTQCRGAYLGAAVGAALLVTIRLPRLAWVMAPAVVAGGAWVLSGIGLSPVLDAMEGAARPGGLGGRLAIWQFAWQVAAANPLHGAGLGLFAAAQPYTAASAPASHAHNLLLQVAMDLGVLGLGVYAAVVAGVAAMLLRLLPGRGAFPSGAVRLPNGHKVRRGQKPSFSQKLGFLSRSAGPCALTVRARPAGGMHHLSVAEVYRRRLHWTLALGAAAALGGMLAHGLVDAALWGNKMACLPWLLFALAASLYRCAKESR